MALRSSEARGGATRWHSKLLEVVHVVNEGGLWMSIEHWLLPSFSKSYIGTQTYSEVPVSCVHCMPSQRQHTHRVNSRSGSSFAAANPDSAGPATGPATTASTMMAG